MTDEKTAPAAPEPVEKALKKPSASQRIDELVVSVAALRGRIEELERNQKIMVDGYDFAANQMRPLYGFGAVALIFDAIYKKLTK